MRSASWFRPPRLVLTLFLGVTGVLSAAMVVLAWQLVDQDRRLAGQRVQERLDGAADGAVGAILRDLVAFEDKLATLASLPADRIGAAVGAQATTLGEEALLLVSEGGRLTAQPSGRVLYYPTDAISRGGLGSGSAAFVRGEALEYQARDLPGALSAYRALARSANPHTRAAALASSARVLAKLHRPDAALDAFGDLRGVAGAVDGLPAGVVASYARCLVLRDEQRHDDLQREARALVASLTAGIWPLTRGEYHFYLGEARSWLAMAEPPAANVPMREALSEGVEAIWRVWSASTVADPDGIDRRIVWNGDTPLLLAWRATFNCKVALVAGPSFVEQGLLPGAKAVLDRQHLRVVLADGDGRQVFGAPLAEGARRVRRAASDTHLPWTLTVGEEDPSAAAAEDASRRRLILAGLVALGIFVFAGSAFILRAARREAVVGRLQTDFVSAVSHEFRTPLASMRQLSELLADGRVATDARRHQYYRTLQRESERLHRLVEALLDFGRMDSGAREYTFAPVDVNALAAEIVSEFGAAIRDRGYTVEAGYGTGLSRVTADREALGRAVWNLLDNAVKYSPGCQTVWISTAQENGRVRISVRDRGVGITPDERDSIFDKFRRGTGAAATCAKGTGLGLAMVRHIVSAHGGRVVVDGAPGEGSTFTIELPVSRS